MPKEQKDDLRVLKTRKALYSSLFILLNRKKFTKITVHHLCEESLVSRTAFYAHYKDKYDLLEQWLRDEKEALMQAFQECADSQVEDVLYKKLQTYSVALVNLLEDADREQQKLILRFFLPDTGDSEINDNETLANFLAGGISNVVFSQIIDKKKTSEEAIKKTSNYVYRMILAILTWNTTAS